MTSKDKNIYWSIYKNLEKEILDLSNMVHFADDQLNVYSIKITDLLVRIVMEIESISKDLYKQEGGPKELSEAYFDTDCLKLLENKWRLSKKKIILSSPMFYFCKAENITIAPLHKAFKRGTSGACWAISYQAVKHHRAGNLKLGNVKNLIYAMGALYILSVYYKNENYYGKKSPDINFNRSLGSDIFSVKVQADGGVLPNGSDLDTVFPDKIEENIYLTILQKSAYKNIIKKASETRKSKSDYFSNSVEYKEYNKHPHPKKENVDIIYDIGGFSFYQKIINSEDKYAALQNSSEYKMYCSKEKITEENFEEICYRIGGLAYQIKITEFDIPVAELWFHSGKDIVLNKGQILYPEEWRNND